MAIYHRVTKFIRNCFQFIRDTIRQKRKLLKNPLHQSAARIASMFEQANRDNSHDRQALRAVLQQTSLEDFWAYYVLSKQAPHYHLPWEGQEMTKFPADIIIYKDLIEKSRPEVLIEIGTQRGVSALFFASLMRSWGGIVVTLDILEPAEAMLEQFTKQGVIFVQGNATYADVAQQVQTIVAGKHCLVIDDGSHTHADVVGAFAHYAAYVPVGGFYIIEDGLTNWLVRNKNYDALGAVDEIVRDHRDQWERHGAYDQFVFFTAYQGILRKK